jgi:ATP-binding cassette subfamily B protein
MKCQLLNFRCFLKFRIFDEPAAALDALAQKAIFQNIEELRGRQTIVHITHHLRSSISADLVLCLKDGELVEQGVSDLPCI